MASSTRIITIPSTLNPVMLFGVHDAHLDALRNVYPTLQFLPRSNELHIVAQTSQDDSLAHEAQAFVEYLIRMAYEQPLSVQDIEHIAQIRDKRDNLYALRTAWQYPQHWRENNGTVSEWSYVSQEADDVAEYCDDNTQDSLVHNRCEYNRQAMVDNSQEHTVRNDTIPNEHGIDVADGVDVANALRLGQYNDESQTATMNVQMYQQSAGSSADHEQSVVSCTTVDNSAEPLERTERTDCVQHMHYTQDRQDSQRNSAGYYISQETGKLLQHTNNMNNAEHDYNHQSDFEVSAREQAYDTPPQFPEHTRTPITVAHGVSIRPKTLGQQYYVEQIERNTITFGIGPAGTGKTFLAVAKAVEALLTGKVNHIILARPAVEAGEKLGFLPGTLNDKIDPYLRPLYDALSNMLGAQQLQRYMSNGTIEVAPLAYMRGRTLNDAFVILDEAQNATVQQLKMFLTRLGFNTHMIITGDITQVDVEIRQSGLVSIEEILHGIPNIAFVHFDEHDVVRHALVGKIIRAYDYYNRRMQA